MRDLKDDLKDESMFDDLTLQGRLFPLSGQLEKNDCKLSTICIPCFSFKRHLVLCFFFGIKPARGMEGAGVGGGAAEGYGVLIECKLFITACLYCCIVLFGVSTHDSVQRCVTQMLI